MKLNAYVVGVGMTKFGKHLDRGLKSLGGEAIEAAIRDAGIDKKEIELAYSGNAVAGLMTGQEMIRGEVVLRSVGIGGIPVINVENACATASTAMNQACAMVTAGLADVALAASFEKLYHEDKTKSFAALAAAVDLEGMREALRQRDEAQKAGGGGAAATRGPAPATGGGPPPGGGGRGSVFMDFYAAAARGHMQRFGTKVEQFAGVSVKNSYHGSLNERAQFREALTLEDVLSAPMIAPPLTRPMCSPIGDGAAAVVIMSERKVRELGFGSQAVRVLSSVLKSGLEHREDEPGAAELCAKEAYEEAGVGPEDLSVIELHDASAPAEVMGYESLGLCPRGEGGRLIDERATWLGGRLPVNTSGGLLRKGHPIGATGIAQIVELTEQIQGRSGERQVEGARIGLAHNNGGTVGGDVAAACVTILGR